MEFLKSRNKNVTKQDLIWKSGTKYDVDDVVVYNDILYRCVKSNSDTSFTSSNWKNVGGYGNATIPTWTSGTSYAVGDFVFYNGMLMRCNTANSDTTFTGSKWDQLSLKLSYFEYNSNGNLIPRKDLVYDEFFTRNANGNIIPKI